MQILDERLDGVVAAADPGATMRCMQLGLVGVVLGAVVALFSSSVAAGARQGDVAPCRSAQLLLTTASAGAGLGTSYLYLVFINLGGPCSLKGYPGVSAVRYGSNGVVQIGPAARRGNQLDDGRPARAVVLARNGTASSVLSQASPANWSAARCRPLAVQALRVFPPGERTPLFVSASGFETACRRLGTYGIIPVVAGVPHALRSGG